MRGSIVFRLPVAVRILGVLPVVALGALFATEIVLYRDLTRDALVLGIWVLAILRLSVLRVEADPRGMVVVNIIWTRFIPWSDVVKLEPVRGWFGCAHVHTGKWRIRLEALTKLGPNDWRPDVAVDEIQALLEDARRTAP